MKRDFLKELGVADDVIDKIMAEHGKTINTLKETVDELETKSKEIETQLKERDNQLNKLSKDAKGNEELETKIKELQEINEKTKTEYEQKLTQSKIDFAIEKTFADALNVKAAKALIDMERVKLNDKGEVEGLQEQKEKLLETDGYLFNKQTEKPTFTDGEHGKSEPNDDDKWVEAFK